MEDTFNNWLSLQFWVDHIPAAIVALAVTWIVKEGRKAIIGFFRYQKKRELLRIKSRRFNSAAVTYDIVKTHCLMVLFFGLCIFYLYVFSIHGNKNHWLITILLSAPVYIFEVLYLWQRSFTKNLVESAGKIRITKQCCSASKLA